MTAKFGLVAAKEQPDAQVVDYGSTLSRKRSLWQPSAARAATAADS